MVPYPVDQTRPTIDRSDLYLSVQNTLTLLRQHANAAQRQLTFLENALKDTRIYPPGIAHQRAEENLTAENTQACKFLLSHLAVGATVPATYHGHNLSPGLNTPAGDPVTYSKDEQSAVSTPAVLASEEAGYDGWGDPEGDSPPSSRKDPEKADHDLPWDSSVDDRLRRAVDAD